MGAPNYPRFLVAAALLACLLIAGACSGGGYDLTPEQKDGYGVYKEYCGQCHRSQKPNAHTAEEWPAVVKRMHTHMVEMKRKVITEQEIQKLLLFLQGHAKT